MKKIIGKMAIISAVITMALSLQSCFFPYHDRGGDRGDQRRDRRAEPKVDQPQTIRVEPMGERDGERR
jgi:hypothetical protein